MSQPHVVIVGAGMVGVATAIWLQRGGACVTIVDRDGPASGASHGNAGVLAASSIVQVPTPGLWRRVPAMLWGHDGPLFLRWAQLPRLAPFLLRYLRSARDTEQTAGALSALLSDCADQHLALARGTPAEAFVHPGDYVFAYRNEAAFQADALGWRLRERHGHPFECMDGEAYRRWDPTFEGRFGFAVRCPEHGTVSDPSAYIRALFDHAVAGGARFVRADVTGIDRRGPAALTEDGSIGGDHLVVTAGVWSRALVGRVPMVAERGYHVEFDAPSIAPRAPTMIASGKFVLTPMHGRLRAAGTVEFGATTPPRSRAPLKLLRRMTMQALPGLEYKATREWMGHRPAPVDSLPLIGAVHDEGPNGSADGLKVWAGFGHHHVGLSAGPKTGRWLAGMIGGTSPNDVAPFDPNRFNDRAKPGID